MKIRQLIAAASIAGLAACASQSPRVTTLPGAATESTSPQSPGRSACSECGRVEKIELLSAMQATPRGGAVLGGVVGGVLAGPAKKAPPSTGKPAQPMVRITVRMLDGRRLVLNQNALPTGVRAGSPVFVRNGRVVPVR